MQLKRNIAFIVMVTSIFAGSWAQEFKLNKVSEKDFEVVKDTTISSSPAVFLVKHRETYFDYSESDSWTIINEVTERIHILSKEGLDYATKKIPLYKKDNDKEVLEKVEGTTYNLEGGKVEKTKLDEKVVFVKDINERWTESAFTMPNAGVGSVVEWSYKTVSPFWKVDDLVLQEDIPVLRYYAKIRTPQMFGFRILKKGSFEITPVGSVENRNLNFTYAGTGGYGTSTMKSNSAKVRFQEIINEYQKENIPALKIEPFVNNINNYRYSIVYELTSTEFSKKNVRNYSTTWPDVARSVFKSENFGKQLENTRFLRNEADILKQKYPNEDERMREVLNFVKSKMVWDGDYGKYTNQSLVKAFREGRGNVAEINLILVALLKEAGLDANPVLISTKSNGVPLFPTLEGFNYVIAGVKDSGKNILLDATEKFSEPNVLPSRAYNWKGRKINAHGASEEIDIYKECSAVEFFMITGEIEENGRLTGNVQKRFSGNEALGYRTKYHNIAKEQIKKSAVEQLAVEKITNFKVENLFDSKEPILESFNFESMKSMDKIGNNLYISPMLFFRLSENPFKSEERQFPVSFTHPFSIRRTVNLKIPESYNVVSLPESLKIALPNNMGSFTYQVVYTNNMIQALSNFFINEPNISSGDYLSLREFYKLRVERENEKIVLEKI